MRAMPALMDTSDDRVVVSNTHKGRCVRIYNKVIYIGLDVDDAQLKSVLEIEGMLERLGICEDWGCCVFSENKQVRCLFVSIMCFYNMILESTQLFCITVK